MKIVFLSFLFISFCYANIRDDFDIYMAQKQYLKYQNSKALYYYQKVEQKNSIIYFNIGDIFYKQSRFYKALNSYKKIVSKQLLAKKYYNMANCYVKLARLQDAVYFYKKSLKIKYDKDAIINLKYIEMILKKIKKIKMIKTIHMTTKIRSGNNKIQKVAHHSIKKPKDYGKKRKKKLISKGLAKNMNIKNQKLSISLSTVKINIKNSANMTKLQEQKYNELLNHKGLQTLLIPLNKGRANDTQNNW